MRCGMKGAVAALLGAVWSLGRLEPFPLYSAFLVKFLAHSMITNRIRCNGHNSERSSLAYMYVHVGILLGKTHALLQPWYSHTIAKHTVAVCTS